MDQSQNQSGLNSNSSCRVNGGPPIPPQDLITLVPSSRPKTEKTRLAKSKSKGKYGDQHETSFRVRGKQAPAILAEVQQSEDDRPLFEVRVCRDMPTTSSDLIIIGHPSLDRQCNRYPSSRRSHEKSSIKVQSQHIHRPQFARDFDHWADSFRYR